MNFNKFLKISIGILFSVSLAMPALAGNASLYLAPSQGTFFVGSTFSVSIYVDTKGAEINAIEVDLKFPPDILQITTPTAGESFISEWLTPPSYSNSGGTISFRGGIPGGIVTSAGLVSTITFRGRASGIAKVEFLDSSKVLLNDGKGTPVFTTNIGGVYEILIPPPEGPKVTSPTHPDPDIWYSNSNPTFSWEKEEGVTDFSYSLDFDSQGIPDNLPEGDFTSISFTDLDDGIWYFHIKAKKAGVWGGTSHYLVQIDSTPPASFIPEITPSTRTSVSQPIVSFITTDALSGFDHFEIKIIDVSPDREEKGVGFFVEATSPYKLPAFESGEYMLVVRAFDKAGNWRDESVKIEIIPKGTGLTKKGIWFFGIFLPWWLIIIIIILLFLLVIVLLILWWKRYWRFQKEKKWKLKEREERMQKMIGEQK